MRGPRCPPAQRPVAPLASSAPRPAHGRESARRQGNMRHVRSMRHGIICNFVQRAYMHGGGCCQQGQAGAGREHLAPTCSKPDCSNCACADACAPNPAHCAPLSQFQPQARCSARTATRSPSHGRQPRRQQAASGQEADLTAPSAAQVRAARPVCSEQAWQVSRLGARGPDSARAPGRVAEHFSLPPTRSSAPAAAAGGSRVSW